MIDPVAIVSSTIGWWVLFFLVKWKWNLSAKATSYAVSFVHGLLLSRGSEYVIYTEQLWTVEKFGGAVTPLQNGMLTMSIGYFLYDIAICFWISETIVTKGHHMFAIMLFGGTLWSSVSGPEVIIAVWLGEFTNVCLNLRYYFEHNTFFSNSKISLLNDIAFGVSFLVMRFVLGTYVVYSILTLGKSLLVVQLVSVCFTLVNVAMGKMVIEAALLTLAPAAQVEKKKLSDFIQKIDAPTGTPTTTMYHYVLLAFTVIWSAYYFLLYCLLRKKFNAEWISRVVAVTHALAISRSVEYTCFFDTWPFDSMGHRNTNSQNIALCLTAGYFVFEIAWCLCMGTEGVLMLLHHTISITAMVMSLWTQRSASEVLLTTWGSELTNPFLQIRWFLREEKCYDTVFAYVNDWLFFLFFFVVRVVVGTCVAYHLYYATETALFMKFCGFSFYALSLVWMLQIFKFAKRRLFGGLKARQKKE